MTKMLLTIILVAASEGYGQKTDSLQDAHTRPLMILVDGNYSDLAIDFDSCTVSYDTVSRTVTVSGILLDRSTKEILPYSYVAIGLVQDSSDNVDKFKPSDSTKTNEGARFSISSKIKNEYWSYFRCKYPGYYTYYIPLCKAIYLFKFGHAASGQRINLTQ